MRRIYKYPLRLQHGNRAEVDMPHGAKLLTVQAQHDAPCLWAMVEPDAAEHVRRTFAIFGTGHDIDVSKFEGPLDYVGTFQLHGGSLVFHVFEVRS